MCVCSLRVLPVSDRGFPGGLSKAALIGELDGKSIFTPYQVTTRFERRRALAATLSDTLYVYDFLEVRRPVCCMCPLKCGPCLCYVFSGPLARRARLVPPVKARLCGPSLHRWCGCFLCAVPLTPSSCNCARVGRGLMGHSPPVERQRREHGAVRLPGCDPWLAWGKCRCSSER
jgi:hypothetical protein